MAEAEETIHVPEGMKPDQHDEDEKQSFVRNAIKKSEQFDYTKWQSEYFDKFTPGELHERAVAYAESHPYQGNAKEVIG
jgi:hypothetical protein